MKKCISHTLLIPLVLFATSLKADTLSINILKVNKNQGNIYIGIFNKAKDFPTGEPYQKLLVPSNSNKLLNTFKLPAGKYAVAVYQDRNKNKRLDRNFLGIPKEKYGFSGRKVFGKPSFKDAAINVKAKTIISINL